MEGYIIIFVLTKSPARINFLYCNDGRIRVDIKVAFLGCTLLWHKCLRVRVHDELCNRLLSSLNHCTLYGGFQVQLLLLFVTPTKLQYVPITTTFTPSNILQPFVKEYVITQRFKAGDYKVLPDTCIAMGFQYSGQHSYIDNGRSILLGSA